MGDDIIFDDTYDDPRADVILQSDDGTGYRVHSYMLKAHSTVLRDMLDVGKPENGGEPIQLDMTRKTLRRFLDLMHDRPRNKYRQFNEETEVLRALDKWGATGLSDKILAHLSECCHSSDAWDMFKIAAQHDNIGLARLAIQRLDDTSGWAYKSIDNIAVDQVEDVPLQYLLGFLAGLASVDTAKEGRFGVIAARFQTVRLKA